MLAQRGTVIDKQSLGAVDRDGGKETRTGVAQNNVAPGESKGRLETVPSGLQRSVGRTTHTV
jgi:hypothetical protein